MIKVAVYETSSTGFKIICNRLAEDDRFQVTIIGKEDLELGLSSTWSRIEYDCVIFPGGAEHIYAYLLSWKFRAGLKDYMLNGGRIIGICGGAQLCKFDLSGFSFKDHLLGLLPYYLYYALFNKRGKFTVKWEPGNLFGQSDTLKMKWAAGPCFNEDENKYKCEAKYAEDKFLLSFKDKKAIISVKNGTGKTGIILFGTHPEYICDFGDNFHLIIKAIMKLTEEENK